MKAGWWWYREALDIGYPAVALRGGVLVNNYCAKLEWREYRIQIDDHFRRRRRSVAGNREYLLSGYRRRGDGGAYRAGRCRRRSQRRAGFILHDATRIDAAARYVERYRLT